MSFLSRSTLAALACCAPLCQAGDLVADLEAGKRRTIVAYGTSLTQNGAWVDHLRDHLQKGYPDLVEVINSGGSGQWSDWGVKNLESKVIAKRPHTVLIEFAINDAVERFGCSVKKSQKNLETMISRIQKALPECEVILMTMTPGDKYPPGHRSHRKDLAEYYEMYRQVAKAQGLLLIDHFPNWIALRKKSPKRFRELVPDTIHPTADGCREIVTPAIFRAMGLPILAPARP